MKNTLYTLLFNAFICIMTSQMAFCECPCGDKVGWDFRDDLLYWTSYETGLGFTTKPSDVLTTSDFTTAKKIQPNFQWEYGFRLLLAYTNTDKTWTNDIAWVHIQTKANRTAQYNAGSPNFQGVFPVWSVGPDTLAGDYAGTASFNLHLHTDLVDLNTQYNWTCFDQWKITPFFGVRFASFRQNMRIKYEGGTFFSGTDLNKVRQKIFGAGPRIGLNTSYPIGCNFSVFAIGAIDPMIGRFTTKQRELYLDAERFDYSSTKNQFMLGLDYDLGVKWQGYLLETWPEVTLSISWEGHTFYYKNRFKDGNFDFFPSRQHLSLYGLTLSAAFNF
jgi:hypothetical protein